MIVGIGTDIVRIQRMKYILSGIEREGFLSKTFTERELRQIQQDNNMPVCLANRFAGKEAVFKAFGTSWRPEDKLTDIEILIKDTGEPYVQLSGRFHQLLESRRNGKVFLSLSSDHEYAVAFAILEANDSINHQPVFL